MIFSNPIPLELCIDSFHLIAEMTSDKGEKSLKRIPMEKLNEKESSSSFKIPANSKCFPITMTFNLNEIRLIKLIGYQIEIFKSWHRINFYEIYKPELEKNYASKATSPIQSHYDIEMIPKLPLIRDIQIGNYAASISQSKYFNLKCKLGTRETFEVSLITEDEDLEIIEFNFNVLNEQLVNRLNTKITLQKQNDNQLKYLFTVDSFNYDTSNFEASQETELEVSSLLEIKYTNDSGRANNLCLILKCQIVVKFYPVYNVSLLNIFDLSENAFQIVLLVRNLLADQSFFVLSEAGKTEIATRLDKELRLEVKKLSLIDFLLKLQEARSFNTAMKDLINERLNLELNLSNDLSFKIKLDAKFEFGSFRNCLFLCPLQFNSQLILNDSSSQINDAELFKLYTLIVCFQLEHGLDEAVILDNYEFRCQIKKRINFKMLTGSFDWTLSVS